MAKGCGGRSGRGRKSVAVKPYRRSKPGPSCYGPGKPGPKTVSVRPHKRSKP